MSEVLAPQSTPPVAEGAEQAASPAPAPPRSDDEEREMDAYARELAERRAKERAKTAQVVTLDTRRARRRTS